jgi:hypothetical protein
MRSDEQPNDDMREAPPAGGSYGQSGIGVGMLVVGADGDPIGYLTLHGGSSPMGSQATRPTG